MFGLTCIHLHGQVRFPERALTFKLESGTAEERDAWVAALEAAATAAQGKATAHTTGTAQLERLKKVRPVLAAMARLAKLQTSPSQCPPPFLRLPGAHNVRMMSCPYSIAAVTPCTDIPCQEHRPVASANASLGSLELTMSMHK
jgi:hypothetical protein